MDIKKIGEEIRSRVSAPVVMLVAALVIAAVVAFWSYGLLQKKTGPTAGEGVSQPITVAAFEIKLGTVLTAELLKTRPYMKESLPQGYFPNPAAAVGRVALYPIQVNEPITESKLAPVNVKAGGMAAVVAPKKRAMAVKVDKVIGISGFIRPGHRVDVLVSLDKSEEDKVPNTITKIVLENILVLAAGPDIEEAEGKKEKPVTVDVITLEVTPEEGEKLALAATEGKLQLALRNYTDTEDVKTRGTTLSRLLASYSEAAPAASAPGVRPVRTRTAPPAAPPRTFTVEIIKGGKISEEKFTRGGE